MCRPLVTFTHLNGTIAFIDAYISTTDAPFLPQLMAYNIHWNAIFEKLIAEGPPVFLCAKVFVIAATSFTDFAFRMHRNWLASEYFHDDLSGRRHALLEGLSRGEVGVATPVTSQAHGLAGRTSHDVPDALAGKRSWIHGLDTWARALLGPQRLGQKRLGQWAGRHRTRNI